MVVGGRPRPEASDDVELWRVARIVLVIGWRWVQFRALRIGGDGVPPFLGLEWGDWF